MMLYKIISLTAFLICFVTLTYHFLRLVRLGPPKDYSQKKGNLSAAISYSFVGAMSPSKKESAYMHLPTYTAGLLYHFGTFVSLVLYFLFLFNVRLANSIHWIIIFVLIASVLSGLGIFIKRTAVKKVRHLSNIDDYISNLIVTIFQLITLMALADGNYAPYYFIVTSLLFLYLPIGKLKHSLYFFAARYHLGFFYGWRGIWPLKETGKSNE